MHNTDLTDESWVQLRDQESKLSIQIDSTGIAYSVLNIRENKFVRFKYITIENDFLSDDKYYDKLATVLREEESLKKSFNSVHFLFMSARYTLIPFPLFEQSKAEVLYKFNHQSEASEKIRINKLKNTEAWLIFSMPETFVNMVESSFPKAGLIHKTAVFIENLMLSGNYDKFNNEPAVFVDVNHGNFDIAVIDHSKLKLSNNFIFQNEQDFCYFIMYVFDQLKLNPEEAYVMLSGDTGTGSKEYFILKKYIRNVSFAGRSAYFNYSNCFDLLPQHKFLNLLNIHRCE